MSKRRAQTKKNHKNETKTITIHKTKLIVLLLRFMCVCVFSLLFIFFVHIYLLHTCLIFKASLKKLNGIIVQTESKRERERYTGKNLTTT